MVIDETVLELTGVKIESVRPRASGIEIVAQTPQRSADCPDCGEASGRVHSYYGRQPADLPMGGRPTRLRLRLKRFRCMNTACPRVTFAEPMPAWLARRSRRTQRLAAALESLAFALGGEAGSRQAHRLHMPCSGQTLLRLIRRAPTPPAEPPRVIGVDDWAKQRGQVYGTLIVDLERRRTIDLLEDRQAETLAAWLRQQPSVQVMARDRSAEYRKAAEEALPQCHQVADRWHLLKNLRETLERMLTRHRRALAPARPATPTSSSPEPTFAAIPRVRDSDHLRYGAAARYARHQAREQLFRAMQNQLAKGLPPAEIARQLGVAPNTVRSYLLRGGPPATVSPRPPRPKLIDPFVEHLTQRWHDGCRNASALWREIKILGFRGARSRVARWVRERREQPAATTPPRFRAAFQTQTAASASTAMVTALSAAVPDSRSLAWLLMRSPEALTPDQSAQLDRLRHVERLGLSYDLAQRFLVMLRTQAAAHLEDWLQAAVRTGLQEWQALASGMRQDLAAIRAALTSPWSNGQTEGQVNKLKLYKRQMYGRAKLDLLRARMLRPL
jgi:transposase